MKGGLLIMADPEIASPLASSEELQQATSSPELCDIETLWLQTFEAAKRQSLALPDPMVALMQAHSCDMLGAGHRLQQVVDTLWTLKPITLKRVERLRPLMDTEAKLSRQVAQLARITRQEARGGTSSR
jgi:hypothetical protein